MQSKYFEPARRPVRDLVAELGRIEKEDDMRIATLIAALFIASVGCSGASAQQVPQINIEASCRTAQLLTLEERDPVEACMRDEAAAQRQLQAIWSGAPAAQRDTCAAETQVGGSPSYVDVLTCLEMYQSNASTAPPRRRRQP
jgi:hypothetical protein